MADADDDELLLDTEAEGLEPDEQDEEQQGDAESGDLDEAEPEILFGDEAAPASGERDNGLIRHLRDQLREKDRRLAEAEKRLPKVELGPKPTIAGCEFDEERFEAELEAWKDRQAAQAREQTQTDTAGQRAREEYAQDEQRHLTQRAALPFKDAEDVEGVALTALNPVQQATIKMAAGNAAQLIYALGKHPGKLAELSRIENPIKLAAAVRELELKLKVSVMPRRQVNEPEEIASGSASVSVGKDKMLEKLEKEADRTGDRTALVRYRKQQNRAG